MADCDPAWQIKLWAKIVVEYGLTLTARDEEKRKERRKKERKEKKKEEKKKKKRQRQRKIWRKKEKNKKPAHTRQHSTSDYLGNCAHPPANTVAGGASFR